MCVCFISTKSVPCSGSGCDAPEYWFKIGNFPGCPLSGTIPIPSNVPASQHSVFRWEWSAHHVVPLGQVEFYVACHDVTIQSAAGPGKPDPLVAIASPDPVGHLSRVASDYKDSGTYGRAGNMVGPQVATWSNCEVGTQGCINSDGFVAPPTPPPVVKSPTNRPTTYSPSSASPSKKMASNAPTPNLRPSTGAPTPEGPTQPTVCNLGEWAICGVVDGYDYGCCMSGLVCEELEGTEGTGLNHCRPLMKCAAWCDEYSASLADCADCDNDLFV